MNAPFTPAPTPAHWTAAELADDPRWIFTLDAVQRAHLHAMVTRAHTPGKALFDYARQDFDLGPAHPTIAAAFEEQRSGRGVALLRGLPREGLSETQFELLTWAIGLHFGVARPQGKASQYISQVRDAGTVYRSAGGRGYSSNAALDFHIDGCDCVALTCYNAAKSGGMSMVTSSMTLHDTLARERPDLLPLFYQPYAYSRQNEEAPGEGPFLLCPMFGVQDGRLFGRLNRNRINSGQKLPGVIPLTARQWEALDLVEEIVRRPTLMYSMWLQAGDMQLVNNHVILHSRTEFEDFEDPAKRRLLYRLWLATPDSPRLPAGWIEAYKSTEPGSVRGGIRGLEWNDACRAYEARQAADLGMILPA